MSFSEASLLPMSPFSAGTDNSVIDEVNLDATLLLYLRQVLLRSVRLVLCFLPLLRLCRVLHMLLRALFFLPLPLLLLILCLLLLLLRLVSL